MNYNLIKSIEEAIKSCKLNGSCEGVKLFDANNTIISANWEEWEVDDGYDVVTVYVYQNDIIMFSYQVEETKILNNE